MSTNPSSPESLGFRWTPFVVLAFVALWPTVGPAELVLSLGAVASMAILAHRRFRDGTTLLSREAWALITALFFCYWLPEFFSAFDAINGKRAWGMGAIAAGETRSLKVKLVPGANARPTESLPEPRTAAPAPSRTRVPSPRPHDFGERWPTPDFAHSCRSSRQCRPGAQRTSA